MNKINILQGHALQTLKTLPADSIHCAVTSPPYWGLRDYGIEPQVWGGAEGCGHEWGEGGSITTGRNDGGRDIGGRGGNYQEDGPRHDKVWSGQFCRHCSAWRGSLGLEPTIDLYVEHMVEIFRKVKRVLRPDGTLFLNLGDSYCGGGRASGQKPDTCNMGKPLKDRPYATLAGPIPQGLKPKDLCGIPWRVAFALQADGWWLRSDIIWSKPNPMPESCTDRPTKSHEYIFLLTKSGKYFWDQEAVRETHSAPERQGYKNTGWCARHKEDNKIQAPFKKNHLLKYNPNGRNLRTVWTLATEPFPEAHFATFPQRLVERCLRAGTSEKGCCPKCGAPWKRVVEKGKLIKTGASGNKVPAKSGKDLMKEGGTMSQGLTAGGFISGFSRETTTLAWTPTCACNAGEPTPCTILDPFGGSGTTALVAGKMGLNAVICELKPEYCEMAWQRLTRELGMLAEIKGSNASKV